MSKNSKSILKRCRFLGIEPGFLGYDKKSKRNNARANKKISEYGLQLREKQKAKFMYGVQEKQFRKYFEKANKMEGKAGENLLILLESRLDNVIYRLGFANSRAEARKLVLYAVFEVNGRKVNIPSYLVKPNDVISVRENKKENGTLKAALEANESRVVPTWLEKNKEKLNGKMVKFATREDIDLPIEEHLIVELYSR